MKRLSAFARDLRPTAFVATMAAIVLAMPQQIQEVYFIDIDTIGRELLATESSLDPFRATRTILLTAVTATLLSLVLWLGSIALISSRKEGEHVTGATFRALPALLAPAPWIGIFLGLLSIRSQIQLAGVAGLKTALHGIIVVVAFLVAAIVGALFFATIAWADRVTAAARTLFGPVFVGFAFVLVAVLVSAIVLLPSLPGLFGTIPLLLLFFTVLAYLLTLSSLIFHWSGFPLTYAIVAGAIAFSMLGWNDNHRVEYTLQSNPPPNLEQTFLKWLDSRQDRKQFEDANKPYPVYIVAAEGGGIYAGYHIASYLARLQDTCPNFAQHVFAISSVSGGSLGGALFASLANRYAKNEPPRGCNLETTQKTFQKFTRSYFDTDFLSPAIGAMLFPRLLRHCWQQETHAREPRTAAKYFSWRPYYQVSGGGDLRSPYDVHHVVLDGTKTFLPLGWRLSQHVMQNIEDSGDVFAKLTFDLVQLELNAKDTAARIKAAAPR